MKAVVYTKYGPPDVVRLTEVKKPTPKDDEILIRISATTLTRTDCAFRAADLLINRLFTGLIKPKRQILGSEFSGTVEAVGQDVTLFRAGGEVFGFTGARMGTHAEYVCLPETQSVTAKPANASFEEAAAVCDGAVIALTCLRKLKVQAGQDVLVYGASGSIGTAVLQLAKYFGARVTAVCGTKNLELMKSLGADEVLDYTAEDFTTNGRTYDVVFDAVGKLTYSHCKGSLKPHGIYLPTDLGPFWQNPFLALWTSRTGGKKVLFPIPRHSKKDIVLFKELIEAGKLRAVIDRRYPLEDIAEAYRYVELGQKTGNVVITLQPA